MSGSPRRKPRVVIGRSLAYGFNVPQSHLPGFDFVVQPQLPLWRISLALGGFCIPILPLKKINLLHTFNAIPGVGVPHVITFESILPRTLGRWGNVTSDRTRSLLLRNSCRAMIAFSHYAVKRCLERHRNWADIPKLLAKMSVVYPSLDAPENDDVLAEKAKDRIDVVFVGFHFARKGGISCLRAAKMALQNNLPVHFHVISGLEYGGGIYTDCADRTRYEKDLALLNLPNVSFHRALPNRDVLALMRKSHILALPTVHDTFGYSVLEGYASGAAAIGTSVSALPELIEEEKSGWLLAAPTDEVGSWLHLNRLTPENSWPLLDEYYQSVADQMYARLETLVEDRSKLQAAQYGGLDLLRRRFSRPVAAAQIGAIYERAIG